MNIRPMQETDRETVLSFMIPFYASDAVLEKAPVSVLQKDIEDCLGDCPFIEGFVMEEEGKAVGYCMTAKSYTTEFGGICVWIEDLYLIDEARGKGYGPQMLAYVEERYRGTAVRLRLEVEMDNVHAVEAYQKSGFHVLPYDQMTKEYPR